MPQNPNEAAAIRNLQTYLRQLSYHNDAITAPPIDGVFASDTEQALRDFQADRGIPVTGVADQAVWELLYASYRASVAANSPPMRMDVFPTTPDRETLSLGAIGFPVLALQFMLGELERKYGFLLPVEQTGIYDAQTRDAVLAFQKQNALAPTGEVDKLTWNELTDQYNILYRRYPEE